MTSYFSAGVLYRLRVVTVAFRTVVIEVNDEKCEIKEMSELSEEEAQRAAYSLAAIVGGTGSDPSGASAISRVAREWVESKRQFRNLHSNASLLDCFDSIHRP